MAAFPITTGVAYMDVDIPRRRPEHSVTFFPNPQLIAGGDKGVKI